ncbi:Short-chain dehydrogenase [Mameliella alba]|uniref:SDR family oxidoreductase n=1 Tax=Mameliella alba TaxID=561184 RepID=UPI00087F2633|nr:SDR family oxidoreductase [Mameliella alba]OWV48364.1 short-chain dehydrogenase [Mameliella alba]PTR40413.1 short-subunit dehydrogenase [Mameliella alba]GGF44771.1 short-chain dehydrogenase [Mameliella alba]SDD02198.1 Short-chain dehydrogenase [Mameliella alba]
MTHLPVLILGARSDMGQAIAHAFAAQGHPIQLAARNAASLDAVRADLALRHGVEVTLNDFDVLDSDGFAPFLDGLPALPQVAVSVVGYMGDQAENEQELDKASLVLRSNFEGPAGILALLANRFEARGSGTLVGVSSVAGDRGRATNYVYGSAKAGFTAFLSGLRNRLAKKGVHVVTVLPGFVNTAMTEGMDLPEKLTAEPQEVGAAVLKAVQKGRNVIYVRGIWWLVMAIIRNIPEPVFKKLKI